MTMSRGGNMVFELIRLLNSEKEGSQYGQADSFTASEPEQKAVEKREGDKRAIKLVRRERDLLSRALKLDPLLSSGHIYKLFGFIGINERAVQDPDFEESFFHSHFHGRVVERVQVGENAVVVELAAPVQAGELGIAQIIEAYRRRGCLKFYEMAAHLQQILELFGVMEGAEPPPEKPESFKKCLDGLGDAMFVCTSGVRKVAISKSLLAYLEYDLEEFCVQAVKFRGIFLEFFSAGSYYSGLTHILALLKYTVQLANNQISLSQFRELATFRFSDFIYSKTQLRSYCDMTLSLLNPSVLCHKVNFVYYREKADWLSPPRAAIVEEKERVRQAEYKTIRRVKNIPHSLLRENQQLIAGYRVVDEEEPSSPKSQAP